MTSAVSICNQAIQNLGSDDYITSLLEDTANAVECNIRYDDARRALLEMHPWNFAKKRASLNQDVTPPLFNYKHQYTLPTDLIWVHMTALEERYKGVSAKAVNDTFQITDIPNRTSVDDYLIEGRKLLSNDGTVELIYIFNEEDPQQFSPTFVQLLARYMSALLAYKITGSKSERDSQAALFLKELAEYQAIDSQQGVLSAIQISEYLASAF